MTSNGKVYIIGAGPGDYKLMTIKAAESIAKADVIVYDRLINRKILKLARKDAELIYVGKMPDYHAASQETINGILVMKALEGKVVARVKGGDPFMFGRGGEEAESLKDNNIEFDIVPGITSAIAVPAYAGIPITHRDFCSSLHIITGHERPDKENSLLDYKLIAELRGTLIFLMGVKNLPEIAGNLIAYGKCADTPAAVIEKGTTANQRVVTGTLEDIYSKVVEAGIKSPAVIVVGRVVELGNKLKWFPRGRLAGKKVIVTRSREQASVLVERIEELGGEALEMPSIKIVEPENQNLIDPVFNAIEDFKWIVFTSVNGVKAFFERMSAKRIDIRRILGAKFCAVGEATAQELRKYQLFADYMPEKYTTEYLLEGMLERILPGEKVLLARADIGSKELSKGLRQKGIDFVDLTVYKTVSENMSSRDWLEIVQEEKPDFITFASSSTVRNFLACIGNENIDSIKDIKVVCIGPVTAKTAEDMGLKVSAVADVYTIDGLVKKLVEISE
jgi:uroporphyrinogen III methyltransferase / synthase